MASLFPSLALLLLPALSRALLVAPNSPCASSCGNQLTTTSIAEITCFDQDYASNTYGAAFQSCINCEVASTYVDPVSNMSDTQALLYNVRFALASCLYGWDDFTPTIESQCLTSFVGSSPRP